MNYNSKDNKSYILQIYLIDDFDLFSLKYTLDGKEDEIFLSNKGHHSIYLGQFSTLKIEDSDKVKYKLVKRKNNHTRFFNKFSFSVNNDQSIEKIVLNKAYLFEDLQENNGQNLYNSFKRLLNISYLYSQNNDAKLLDDIKYSLDFIFNNWYTGKINYSGNWWFYEIGIPRCLNEILYILRNDLDKGKIFNYLNTERFYLPSAKYIFYRRNYPNIYREEATCANLAENIYICTLREILHENDDALDELFDQIEAVIKTTTNHDGFYLDGSFIQHENIPYNASYGEVLLKSIARLMEIFNLLDYDCTNYMKKIEKIILNSYYPFLYDGKALECVRGRAVSRIKLNARYSYNNIIHYIEKLYKMYPSDTLLNIINNEKDNYYQTFSKAFNYIDRYIYRNNDYLLSINLNSNYIANYESINGENLLGDYSSNYTYDLIYNNHKTAYEYPRSLFCNPYYRNGSTNTLNKEEPNLVYNNCITAGVEMDNLLSTCWHQNNEVSGYFSKCYLGNSLVCIGTNICSKTEYVSTIYNFNDDYIEDDGDITINKMKIVCKNNYILENYDEIVNPNLLNVNEPNIDIRYKGNRIYLKNPSNYEYQIYPNYVKNDEYQFIDLNGCHLLIHDNYYFISSFVNSKFKYEDLEFSGIFSAIIKKENDNYYVNISTGKRILQHIYFDFYNYNLIEADCDYNDNIISLEDELVHKLSFRR